MSADSMSYLTGGAVLFFFLFIYYQLKIMNRLRSVHNVNPYHDLGFPSMPLIPHPIWELNRIIFIFSDENFKDKKIADLKNTTRMFFILFFFCFALLLYYKYIIPSP
jgi:hypothetical protein